MSWDERKIELLRKLWDEGLSAAQCAERIGGVTRNAVIGKVHRLKLQLRGRQPGIAPPHKRGGWRNTRAILDAVRNTPRAYTPQDKPVKAKPKLPELPDSWVPEPETLAPRVKDITALSRHHCRWPIGDPREPGFGYCGRGPIEGLSYCPHHARKAFRGPEVAVRKAMPATKKKQKQKEFA